MGCGGEGSDDVVGFVVRFFYGGDAKCGEEVFEDGDLANEFGGCFVALGFVVGEHFGAEGGASNVEGDCYVGGLFVVKQGGEHGEEPVYGVGCLACAGGEFFGGEGVECAEGHGMSIDEHEAVFLVSHSATV